MVLDLFLAFYVVLAMVCFHFGWRGAHSDYRARGGFLLCVLVFIPTVLFFRWAHATAEARLQAAGVTPHPAIAEPMGMATGLEHASPTWVFALNEPGSTALAFYRDPSHLAGWRLDADAGNMLVFRRDGRRLIITGGDKPMLTYLISTVGRGPDAAPATSSRPE